MAGMNLGGQGGVGVKAGGMFSSSAQPATASQAAFGTQTGGAPSTYSSLWPNDPFGVALWMAMGAAVLLIAIRHGLPG